MLYNIVHQAYTKPIHNMIGRSVQRSENGRTLVPIGNTSTHKQVGIDSSLGGSTDHSKTQMDIISILTNVSQMGGTCSPDLKPACPGIDAYNREITLIASSLTRHQQPGSRPRVNADDDISQAETSPFLKVHNFWDSSRVGLFASLLNHQLSHASAGL